MVIKSDLPMGAGLGSSAAFCVCIAAGTHTRITRAQESHACKNHVCTRIMRAQKSRTHKNHARTRTTRTRIIRTHAKRMQAYYSIMVYMHVEDALSVRILLVKERVLVASLALSNVSL